MYLQMLTLVKCLVAVGAGKWLFSCVGPFMLLQIPLLSECLATYGAGKWLLSCVDPFMDLIAGLRVFCAQSVSNVFIHTKSFEISPT